MHVGEDQVTQRTYYRNVDRVDEDLCEESDFELSSIATLLVGDQNAGKTTLLHSLADESQRVTFLSLQSLIPSVSTLFTNTRFCDVSQIRRLGLQPERLCCDEGVEFVDSDIARTVITIPKIDWRFLLQEIGAEDSLTSNNIERQPSVVRGEIIEGLNGSDKLGSGGTQSNGLNRTDSIRKNQQRDPPEKGDQSEKPGQQKQREQRDQQGQRVERVERVEEEVTRGSTVRKFTSGHRGGASGEDELVRFTLLEFGGDHLDRLRVQYPPPRAASSSDRRRPSGGGDRGGGIHHHRDTEEEFISASEGETCTTTPYQHGGSVDDDEHEDASTVFARVSAATNVAALFDTSRTKTICENSHLMLRSLNLTSIAYFINGLVAVDSESTEGPVRVRESYLSKLEDRVRCLKEWCPHLASMHVFVTRLPPIVSAESLQACENSSLGGLQPGELVTGNEGTLVNLDPSFIDVVAAAVGDGQAEEYEGFYRRTILLSPLYQKLKSSVLDICRHHLPAVQVEVSPLRLIEQASAGSAGGGGSALGKQHLVVNPCAVYYSVSKILRDAVTLNRTFGSKSSDPEILKELSQVIKDCRFYTPPPAAGAAVAPSPLSIDALLWLDKRVLTNGYEVNSHQHDIPLCIFVSHASRLLMSLAQCHRLKDGKLPPCTKSLDDRQQIVVSGVNVVGCRELEQLHKGMLLLGIVALPKKSVQCTDDIVRRRLQQMRIFERCPITLKRLHLRQKHPNCVPFEIEMSPMPTTSTEKCWRLPFSAHVCGRILKCIEDACENRHDQIDWQHILHEAKSLREEINDLDVSDLELLQPVDSASICLSAEAIANKALDIFTLTDHFEKTQAAADGSVYMKIAGGMIDIVLS